MYHVCMYVCMYVCVGILHIGTHHTGVSFGNLVSFVTELELVTGTGEVNTICVHLLITADRQTDRETGGHTDRLVDRQTDEHV